MANGNQKQRNPFGYGGGNYGLSGYGPYGRRGGGAVNPYRKPQWGAPNMFDPAWMAVHQAARLARDAQNQESDGMLNKWVKDMTDIQGDVNATLAKVSPKMMANFQNLFKIDYDAIGDEMRLIDGLDDDDPVRMEGLWKIEQMKNKWTNTNTQAENLFKAKTNFLDAKTSGSLSDYYGQNPDQKSHFANLFSDNADFTIDAQGNILYSVGYNKHLPSGEVQWVEGQHRLHDLPDVITKDFAYAEHTLKRVENLTKAKQPLTEINKNLLRQTLRQELSDPSRLYSWLTDDFIVAGGFGIDESLIGDPSRFNELRDVAVEQTLQLYENIAKDAYDKEQKRLSNLNNTTTTGITPEWHTELDTQVASWKTDNKIPTRNDWNKLASESKWAVQHAFKQIKDGEDSKGKPIMKTVIDESKVILVPRDTDNNTSLMLAKQLTYDVTEFDAILKKLKEK